MQGEPGREQRCVGVTGAQLKCFVQHLEGECEKWEGGSLEKVYPLKHWNLLCAWSLCWQRVLWWFQQYECFFLTFLFPLAALVMVLNSTSVSWSARIQIFLTFCKLVAILIIIVPGVIQLIKGMKWKVNASKVLLSLPSPVFLHLPLPNNAYSSKIS